jgi:uncharacterized protein
MTPATDTAMDANEPVTVVVKRRVRAGHEGAYESWLARLVQDASALPGYLGTNIHRPPAGGGNEYTSVFRFDSVESLRVFEESDLRRRALGEVIDHVEADATWEKLTGLEFWFTPPAGTVVPQPSRFRMALVMIAIVYGLVLSIGKLVALALGDAPMAARLLVTIAIEIFLMTYVLMPRITRLLARFIYPKT